MIKVWIINQNNLQIFMASYAGNQRNRDLGIEL